MHPTMERARAHFASFAEVFWPTIEPAVLEPGWHMRAICAALQDVTEGRIQKLAICIPPRHSKSLLASVLWPAWLHARDPKLRILTASHSLRLAYDFSKRHREIVRSPLYAAHYPWTRIKHGNDAAGSWELTAGGRRFSGAVGARITGHGGSILIIDDPHDLDDLDSIRAREDVSNWYRTAWLNRRDTSEASEVIIMQRSASDDLVGEVGQFGFKVLSIPALATDDPPRSDIDVHDPRAPGGALVPGRVSADELEVLKREMGRHFNSVYQQDPRPGDAALFNREWFREPPADYEAAVVRRIRYWDKAATAAEPGRDPDWTVGARVALLAGRPSRFVLENIVRLRDSPMRTQAKQIAVAEADTSGVAIAEEQEPGSSGVESIQRRVEALKGYSFMPDRKTGPKEERWNALSVQAEAGNVFLPTGAGWAGAFFDEAEAAPNGRHDDQLDAVSGALTLLRRRGRLLL